MPSLTRLRNKRRPCLDMRAKGLPLDCSKLLQFFKAVVRDGLGTLNFKQKLRGCGIFLKSCLALPGYRHSGPLDAFLPPFAQTLAASSSNAVLPMQCDEFLIQSQICKITGGVRAYFLQNYERYMGVL